MKTFIKPFALLSILGNSLPTHAVGANDTQLERQLVPKSGEFCTVSASVKCTFDNLNGQSCDQLGVQPLGTCGQQPATYEYKICNLGDRNVNPVAIAPESGEVGTTAQFRQQENTPKILLGTLGPGVCRTAYKYENTMYEPLR